MAHFTRHARLKPSASRAVMLITVMLALLSVRQAIRAAGAADELLVVVNGEPLTSAVLDSYRRDVHSISDDSSSSNQLVEDIDRVLVIQDGRSRGYMLTDAQFSSVLDSIKKDNRVTDDAQFARSLQAAHLTTADLRRRLERQMIVSRMQALKGASPITVTDESARRYYLSHADEFSDRSFEDARDLVEQRLNVLERQGQWAAYVQALESRAVIDWRSADAQRAYAIGLTERSNSRR